MSPEKSMEGGHAALMGFVDAINAWGMSTFQADPYWTEPWRLFLMTAAFTISLLCLTIFVIGPAVGRRRARKAGLDYDTGRPIR
jgi:hypothetical protein